MYYYFLILLRMHNCITCIDFILTVCILLHRPHDVFMIFLSPIFLQQHGRSDSYRVATLPNIRDDNKTADGMYKVYSEVRTLEVRAQFLHNIIYFRV